MKGKEKARKGKEKYMKLKEYIVHEGKRILHEGKGIQCSEGKGVQEVYCMIKMREEK